MFEDMHDLKARAGGLARAHRVPFDRAYTEWLEADSMDGAPSIDRFMGDIDEVVLTVLGPARAEAVRAAVERAEGAQEWEAHDDLVAAAGEVYAAYRAAFEYGVK